MSQKGKPLLHCANNAILACINPRLLLHSAVCQENVACIACCNISSLFKHMTNFLNLQERGGFRKAVQPAAGEAPQAVPFHAAPVPQTLHRPAPLPSIPEKQPTTAMPFNLISEARRNEVCLLSKLFLLQGVDFSQGTPEYITVIKSMVHILHVSNC